MGGFVKNVFSGGLIFSSSSTTSFVFHVYTMNQELLRVLQQQELYEAGYWVSSGQQQCSCFMCTPWMSSSQFFRKKDHVRRGNANRGPGSDHVTPVGQWEASNKNARIMERHTDKQTDRHRHSMTYPAQRAKSVLFFLITSTGKLKTPGYILVFWLLVQVWSVLACRHEQTCLWDIVTVSINAQ